MPGCRLIISVGKTMHGVCVCCSEVAIGEGRLTYIPQRATDFEPARNINIASITIYTARKLEGVT